MTPAQRDGNWIRPVAAPDAEPRWGVPGGMQLSLPPTPGPRGLLRIFTPYLDQPRDRLVNFIAVEPIPVGTMARGFSELEPSTADPGQRGKRLWAMSALDGEQGASPARGGIDTVDGVERLTVWIGVERFDDGADVAVRVAFRADRPHEVEVSGFVREGSVALDRLILTATMGNWARLRRLHLAERVATPAELWPGFDRTDFTAHARFPLDDLSRAEGAAIVSATSDEEDPSSATHAEHTADHWRYVGHRGVQSWRVDDPDPKLEALVNGRWAYWASSSPIPGGVAYENFEISQPFRQGASYRFSVEPDD